MHLIATKHEGKWNRPIDMLLSYKADGTFLITAIRLTPLSDVKDYRKAYFAKLSFLASEVGETKHALHEFVKENLLNGDSTTTLDETGWLALFHRLEFWAWDNYNVILP